MDFSNGPDTPWVSGRLRPMRYFWDFARLYTSLLGVSCIYSGIGNPSGLLELGQLTIVDYQVANYTRQGVPRKSLVNERL